MKSFPVSIVDNTHMDSRRWSAVDLASGDVIISTCYKSGTTWTSQIVLQLLTGGVEFGPDHEFQNINDAVIWPEFRLNPLDDMKRSLSRLRGRRVFKSHLPAEALPFRDDVAYVIVARNVPDVAISLWDHYHSFTQSALKTLEFPAPPAEFGQFWRRWLHEDGYPFWSYFGHTASFWELRKRPNVLLLHYDDMLRNPRNAISRIAAYLGIRAPDSLLESVSERSSFAYMKMRPHEFAPPSFLLDQTRFINVGRSGRGRVTLGSHADEWQAVARSKLPELGIRWLASGDGESSALRPQVLA